MEKSQFAKNEEEILKYWQEKEIFKKTLQKDSPQGNFVFYEGPPTANGRPGIHHVLARVFKDVMPRYKTMQGFHVERKAGWDTHGLPVELQVEKALGISGKPDIERYGIEAFNKKCKESVWEFKDEWEKLTERIAFWLDMKNAYVTYENEYVESVWWVLKQIHNFRLLYKGYKVVPQCPRCGTALSSHEVAQGYKKVIDSSIYIKFKVKNQENTYILSWTTTPWTLPGNIALAVGADIDYVKVKYGTDYLILAKALMVEIFGENLEIIEEMKGSDLVCLEYEPLFPGAIDPGDKKAWYVSVGDFVTVTDGTGIVHTAAMYGEDDFNFGLEHDLPLVHTVDESGKFKDSVVKWAGQFVKDEKVEQGIIKDLEKRELLFKEKPHEHDYPFCWRCDSPLLYYAKDSWFIKMSVLSEELVARNKKVNWVPEYIKEGRFGEWLKNIKDWAISRQRYWGAPIPVWECDKCQKFEVIESLKELESKVGELPKDSAGKVDVHRPFIDKLKYRCECGGKMTRVPDVFDVWLDSGTMPFSQYHYPFENKELIDFGDQYPADYICEAIDQTRGWFYTLMAIASVLGREAPFKNVICLGHVMDKEGKKMSKSRGNVVDPWLVVDQYGVDALRMMFYSVNQPGDTKNFDEKVLKEVLRKVVMLTGNVVNFYEMYQGGQSGLKQQMDWPKNVLDHWIVSSLEVLIRDVTIDLEVYHIFEASRKLIAFIDELSTWYVRRSRDRFKNECPDKEQAIYTLHFVLSNLVRLMAPFTPFMAERVYQRLGGKLESVHLEEWPVFDEKLVDEELLKSMMVARQVVELGLAARDEAKIKVRQPLSCLEYQGAKFNPGLEMIIAEELNVKEVKPVDDITVQSGYQPKEGMIVKVSLCLEITDELHKEGNCRELVRLINNMRKQAGLTIEDRVILYWETKSTDLQIVMNDRDLVKQLMQNTIILKVVKGKIDLEDEFNKELTINNDKIWLGLKK